MDNIFTTWKRYMTAAAFAEGGDFETAVNVAGNSDRQRDRQRVRPDRRARVERPRPTLRAPSMDE
ncbi:MAG: hypothetical protein ACLFOY_17895 [Desulfatibacillaceae bacterium]